MSIRYKDWTELLLDIRVGRWLRFVLPGTKEPILVRCVRIEHGPPALLLAPASGDLPPFRATPKDRGRFRKRRRGRLPRA